jgi:hypothetical protein
MYDLIGDVHGHADKLQALLHKLGYQQKNGSYSHPERKVLFVGDYIDRGPDIPKTLEIVRNMVDHDQAIALMGNHEYNALCFNLPHPHGDYLRPHNPVHIHQHSETMKQFHNKKDEYRSHLEWFKTLPLFYENDSFRAVHACWDDEHIAYLKQHLKDHRLTEELIYESADEETHLHHVIEETLKGKEIQLPNGVTFKDKDGHERCDIRIKWWENPSNTTYKSISVHAHDLCEEPINVEDLANTRYYTCEDKAVFFGHYWLNGNPSLYRSNICCLDYSVAKAGHLVAYRFDEEQDLDREKLVYV